MRHAQSTVKTAKTHLAMPSIERRKQIGGFEIKRSESAFLKTTLNQIRFWKSSVSSHRQSNAKDFNNAEPNLFLQIKREKPSPKQREEFESNAEPNSCLQINRE